MKMIPLNEKFSVAGQLDLLDFKHLRQLGVRTIINNRPDGEDASQPGTEREQAAAKEAGLEYFYIPISGARVDHEVADRFREVIAKSSGPVVAHCRTGVRSFYAWVLANDIDVRNLSDDDLICLAQNVGISSAVASEWLATNRSAPIVKPDVRAFFDPRTFSMQYVVSDPQSGKCAIIDPVLDYDEKSGSIRTTHADNILAYVNEAGLTVQWILDTHPHADHLTAATYLKSKTGAQTAIGEHVVDVQKLWKSFYNLPDFPADGRQWDRLFSEGDLFAVGAIQGKVMFSPGHTLASITYLIGDAAFVHDTLFMPDSGTARADFPGGCAIALWESIQAILSLPGQTRLFTGHDYQPGGRAPQWESTVYDQKHLNSHIVGQNMESFIALRVARDRMLPMPKLILHALQVNIAGGGLPKPESNGSRYLKLPLGMFPDSAW